MITVQGYTLASVEILEQSSGQDDRINWGPAGNALD